LLNPAADFLVLDKLAAISGSNANIYRFDESFVIFQISAKDLLRQFVGFQASLGSDLRQLGFLLGLKTYFHKHSLGRLVSAVKQSATQVSKGETWAPEVTFLLLPGMDNFGRARLQ
jgi:hypothetical protein